MSEDLLDLSCFTNHSGGAYGVDTFGHITGYWHGFYNHNHYRPAGNEKLSQKLRILMASAVIIDLDEARTEVNKILNTNYKNNLFDNLKVRNYFQVKFSDAVYCFSRKISDNEISGGTNTAFQLAIKMGKTAYVFDIDSMQWFIYNEEVKSLCELSETPVLTFDYAIIGTRDIENYNTRNRSTGEWESRKEYLGDEKSSKIISEIENLYKVTLDYIDR